MTGLRVRHVVVNGVSSPVSFGGPGTTRTRVRRWSSYTAIPDAGGDWEPLMTRRRIRHRRAPDMPGLCSADKRPDQGFTRWAGMPPTAGIVDQLGIQRVAHDFGGPFAPPWRRRIPIG